MIGIKVNGEFLELYSDTRVNLKLRNPIFNDNDVIPGSYSIPFSIPGGDISQRNARILGHPEQEFSVSGKKIIPNSELLVDGFVLKCGDLLVNQVSGKEYSIHFRFGLRTLDENFKNVKIRDIVDETITMTTGTYTKGVYIQPAAGYSGTLQIIVNGIKHSANQLNILATVIDAADPNVTAVYYATGATPLGQAAPYVHIYPTNNADDPETDFTVNAWEPTTSSRANWYIETTSPATYHSQLWSFLSAYFSANPPDNKLRFPLVFNDAAYDEKDKAAADKVMNPLVSNLYKSSSFKWSDPNWGVNNSEPFVVANYSSLQPFVMLKYVLDKIALTYDFQYEGDFYDDPELAKALVMNTYAAELKKPYIGTRDFLFYRSFFNMRDLVPDITVEELFKMIQNKFNVSINYIENTRKMSLKYRDVIMLNQDYENISSYASPVVSLEDDEISGIRLETKIDKNDALATDDFYETGTPETTISSALSGLAKDTTKEIFTGVSYTGPEQRIKFGDDFTTKLIFYTGLDAGAENYPKASYFGWNMRFDTGLADERWKYYIRFLMSRRRMQFDIDYTLRHLISIDWEKKYMINGMKYLFSDIDVTISMHRIELSKASVVRV